MPNVNMPAPFEGTEAERKANNDSHFFSWDGGDTRCSGCDCRPFSRSADWPCGSDVPRVVQSYETAEDAAAACIPTAVLVARIMEGIDLGEG